MRQLVVGLALAGCQSISGLEDIEIVDSPIGGSGAAPALVCDDGTLDRNREDADGCELVAPIPTDALVLWLSPDYGITETEVGVKDWLDQSSKRNDFEQELPSSRPVLLANQLNGLAALGFDGDKLQTAQPMQADFSRGFTYAAVVRRDVVGFEDTLFDMVIEGGANDSKNIYMSQAGNTDDTWFGTTVDQPNVVVSSAGLYTQDVPHLITIVAATDLLRFRYDGVSAVDDGDEPPTLPSTDALIVVLGANIAEGELTRFHHGLVAEIVMYERALDDDELTGVEQYLQMKWGL